MNTQEQQTQNIQSQEQKNRNPKYSKICTQILPQKSIVHKHQPRFECFFFFLMFLSGADLGLEQIQWRHFCLLKTNSIVSHHQPQHQNDIIHLLNHSSNDAILTTKRILATSSYRRPHQSSLGGSWSWEVELGVFGHGLMGRSKRVFCFIWSRVSGFWSLLSLAIGGMEQIKEQSKRQRVREQWVEKGIKLMMWCWWLRKFDVGLGNLGLWGWDWGLVQRIVIKKF